MAVVRDARALQELGTLAGPAQPAARGGPVRRVPVQMRLCTLFTLLVLCAVAVGIAFGVMIHAYAVGRFGVQLVAVAAMIAAGVAGSLAVRPVHAALDGLDRDDQGMERREGCDRCYRDSDLSVAPYPSTRASALTRSRRGSG